MVESVAAAVVAVRPRWSTEVAIAGVYSLVLWTALLQAVALVAAVCVVYRHAWWMVVKR